MESLSLTCNARTENVDLFIIKLKNDQTGCSASFVTASVAAGPTFDDLKQLRAQLLPVARHFRLGTLPPGAVVAIAQIYLGNKKALFEYLHNDLKSINQSLDLQKFNL